MPTALNPKPNDDPHDVLVVAPGVAVMVPTDEELSKLARSLRHPPYPQAPTEADLPPAAAVPPVDTTFRPTAVGDVKVPGQRLTTGGKAARALAAALVVAAYTGAARSPGSPMATRPRQMIAQWTPQRILALLPLEKPAQAAPEPAPPAAEATAANPGPRQQRCRREHRRRRRAGRRRSIGRNSDVARFDGERTRGRAARDQAAQGHRRGSQGQPQQMSRDMAKASFS